MKAFITMKCQWLVMMVFLIFSSYGIQAQTVTKTSNPSTTTSVDGVGNYGLAVPNSLSFTTSDFTNGCSITDVNVRIRWAKTDNTCAAPGTGSSFHPETSFRLDGPDGTQVILVQPGTYTGTATMSLITTTFDQAAGSVAGGATPVGGTFRPNNGNLNNFNGRSGLGTWTLRAGDNSGGDALCVDWWSITIATQADVTAPTAACGSVTKVLSGGGTASIVASEINNGSSDLCGVSSISATPTSFTCSNVGLNPVTLTVTDVYGNSAACTGFVTVDDNQAPTISCPADVSVSTNTGSCTATSVSLGTPTTSDNCPVTVTNDAPSSFPVGTTVVTWTVTDGGGNSQQCTQNVTVSDNEDPVITCPGTVTAFTNSGSCSALGVVLGTPVANDNCTVTGVTNDAPTFFPLGSTTVTWTAVDAAGNSVQCTQTVIVTDNVEPTITCAGTETFSTDVGACEATGITLTAPTTADNCSVASVTNDAPSTYPLGNTTVTWTVTDAAGNSEQCTQTVIIEDQVAPDLTVPADVVVDSDPGACEAVGVALGGATFSDNCGLAGNATNDAPASFPVGVTTVTWSVTDQANNTTTATQLVTVSDNEAPTITCEADIVYEADSGCEAGGVPIFGPTTDDNCGVVSVTDDAPFPFPLGETLVTWVATDAAGNSTSCVQLVTIIESVAPTIVCPADITVETDDGVCEYAQDFGETGMATATDNCTAVGDIVITNNAPAVYPLGATTVTWVATDDYGNTTSCDQIVTVSDTEAPGITCAAVVMGTTDNNTCSSSTVVLPMPNTWDNCGVASVVNDGPAVYSLGDTEVIWTVTDDNGNTTTCLTTVTVLDEQAPEITCPADMTINPDAGSCEATGVALGSASSSDNCTASVSNDAPGVYPLGETIITWTVTDAGGNTATCAQIITVTDEELPTIVCEADVTMTADPGMCGNGTLTLVDPTVADNCPGTLDVTNNAPAVYPVGETVVTWVVTDLTGNSASCDQLVTITDDEAPIVSCMAVATFSTDPGVCDATVTLTPPNATDNCNVASVTSDAPAVFPLGDTDVTWTITDDAGNVTTCLQTVTVVDDEPPMMTCPADVNVPTTINACDASSIVLGTPVVTDNCGVSVTATNDAPAVYPLGETEVVWMVTDDNGNMSSCIQLVTVFDFQAPFITCPGPVTATLPPGSCEATVSLGTAIAVDNCTIASTESDAPATFPAGVHTVIWTTTDGSGNTATCEQMVTVTDNEAPTISCGSGVTVVVDPGECTIDGANLPAPTAMDNCTVADITNDAPASISVGTIMVTWTATDDSGNTATCMEMITVVDEEDPVVAAPADVEVSADAGTCEAATVSLGTPTAVDNCTIVDVSPDNSGPYPVGETTVVWTATDDSGNTATATQVVTVTDDEAPTVTCMGPIAASTDPGSCEATIPTLMDPMADDNCGVASITNDGPATYPVGETTVTWTVTDESGNTASCTQVITVTDVEAPTISCAEDVTASTDPGTCDAAITLDMPTSDDNCGVASVTNDGPAVYPVGETTVTWVVTDDSGNAVSCTQLVTVTDDEAPTISCAGAVTLSDPVTSGDLDMPTSDDNCGVASVTSDAPATLPIGVTTVTWTVTDDAGNEATCSQDVTVEVGGISLAVSVFLEGPYSGGVMGTALGAAGSIPTTSPNGATTTVDLSGVVDWVTVELRSDMTTVAGSADGLLLPDGSIVDPSDGTSDLFFDGMSDGSYYVVISHRNHIDIMTDAAVSSTDVIDFTNPATGIMGGPESQKDVGGSSAMWAGDSDNSGTVNAADRANTWNSRNQSGYLGADVDMSGTCNAADRAITWNNRNKSTSVP